MSEADPVADTTALAQRPGERLRDARIAQDLDLGDIAARTRIPQRHLESIEAGTYEDLPSVTYAIGFARAYARTVGVDEVVVAADVRSELSTRTPRTVRTVPVYEVEDPSRMPPRGLVIGGIVVALLLMVGVALWYGTNLFRGGPAAPAPASETAALPIPEKVAAAPTPPPGSGQVAITATDEVWVRVSAGDNQTLLMKTMTPGERFDVPADAKDARIEAGRPDKLAVTVNGSAVTPLGDGRVAIKGVSLAAASLIARGRGSATPPPAPAGPAASVPSRDTSAPDNTPTTRPFEPAFGNTASPL